MSRPAGRHEATRHAPSMTERTAQLLEQRAAIEKGGGEARLEKQHAQGKLTARERVLALLDPGTFEETGMFARHQSTYFGLDSADYPADGVVTGEGAVLGRPVHVASQDFTLAGYGRVFYNNVLLSGVVPQISIIAGPCAGGAAYSPALTDFIIQTRQAHMFITGPQVIAQVTGEQVTSDDLGGADAHMALSGVTHFVADDDEQAILIAKKLLTFLPQNNSEDPPVVDPDYVVEPDPGLPEVIPASDKKGYDVREVIL